MIKVLVTGGNGQLGSSIKAIANEHEEIHFVFTDYLELDITNKAKTKAFFEINNFDYCINCAAYTAVDKAEEEIDKAYAINAEGAKNLAESCLLHDVIMIHVSTDFVFDGKKSEPYLETDQPNPISVYGASKLKGEHYVQDISKKYFIFRTSWVYSEYGHNFVKTMLRLAKDRDEISVVSDQFGSPTYAGDLAEFIIFLIINKNYSFGLYHYSNSGTISWYEFAVEIFKQKDSSTRANPIPTADYITPANRPKYSCLSKNLIQETFGVNIPCWKDSLREVLKKK